LISFKTSVFKLKFPVVFCLFFFVFVACLAQKQNQENLVFLSKDTFEELSTAHETSESPEMALGFAHAFLLKAKQQNNQLRKAEGYYKAAYSLTQLLDYPLAKQYLDSVILLTKENYSNQFPVEAYILKANVNGAQAHFSKAMDDLAKATEYANKTGSKDQKDQIKYFIALLKNNVGEYQESMSLLKETLLYRESRFLENEQRNLLYLRSLYAVGNQFNTIGKPDSSLNYIKKAIAVSLKTKDSSLYDRLVFTAAISHKLKAAYRASLDSLKKYEVIAREIGTSVGTSIGVNSTFGSVYSSLGENKTAIAYFKKVDSIAHANNYFSGGLRTSYEHLIDYYKDINDINTQLFYINRLLKIDSITTKDITYLSKNLNDKYDTPNLLKQKEKLINKLENKNSKNTMLLFLISGITVVLMALLIWHYRKQKMYKKRFEELIKQRSFKNVISTKQAILTKVDLDIPKEVVATVLQKLEAFEHGHGYLKLNLTLGGLQRMRYQFQVFL